MTFLEKLDIQMKGQGLNKSKLSQISGVPYTTIDGFYKKGYGNAKISTIRKIARALGCSLDYLMEDDSPQNKNYAVQDDEIELFPSERTHIIKYRSLDDIGKEAVDAVLDVEHRRVKQAGDRPDMEASASLIDLDKIIPFRISQQPASAGTGVFLDPEYFTTIYILKNDLTRRASFAVPVSGRSMEPHYYDGDILLVEWVPEVEIGQIGVFTIGGEGFVKKRGNGELISLNPEYDPVPMEEGIRCNGRVIGILKPEWILDR